MRTAWHGEHRNTLVVVVDTSHCKYSTTPQYVVSIMGDETTWTDTGSHSIESAYPTNFTVVLVHPTLEYSQLSSYAIKHWQVSWIADDGANSGKTTPGYTGWQSDDGGLFVDVDSTLCGYSSTPAYFTSFIQPQQHRFAVQGSRFVSNATKHGFSLALWPSTHMQMKPFLAEQLRWHVSWIGVSISD